MKATNSTSNDPLVGDFAKVGPLISSKLNALSHHERTRGLYDLHGVVDLKEIEAADTLEETRKSLTLALSSACSGGCIHDPVTESPCSAAAYSRATSMSQDYVEKLKVPFLLSESSDAQKAAGRLIRFFACKSQLFGADKLVQDITLDDLNRQEEIDALKSGIIQILPKRDQSGRKIIVVQGEAVNKYSNETVVSHIRARTCQSHPNLIVAIVAKTRVLFCLALGALNDETIQRNGIVGIYMGTRQESCSQGRASQLWKTWNALPWRTAAFHLCINIRGMSTFAHELCDSMDSNSISRFRVHNGSNMDCMLHLSTFGIQKEAISTYILEGYTNQSMLENQRRQEDDQQEVKSSLNTPTSEPYTNEESVALNSTTPAHAPEKLIPCPMDIIMGRGRQVKGRPGALRFHRLLSEYRTAYDTGCKYLKYAITEEILCRMKKSGSRFLIKKAGGKFELSNDASAREKISHDFRNLRLKCAKSTKNKSAKRAVSTTLLHQEKKVPATGYVPKLKKAKLQHSSLSDDHSSSSNSTTSSSILVF